MLLTDDVLACKGMRARYVAPEPVGRAAIRYFVLATEDSPVFWLPRPEEDGLAVAPTTMVCETNQFYERPMDSNGYIGHIWDLPIPPSRTLRGGNEYTFFRDLREDDVVTVEWQLSDIQETTTSAGAPLLVVVSDVHYLDADGAPIAYNRETMLFQSLETSS